MGRRLKPATINRIFPNSVENLAEGKGLVNFLIRFDEI